MANIEELELALKRIEQAPVTQIFEDSDSVPVAYSPISISQPPEELEWDQTSWVRVGELPEGFCLTAGCLAGHVAVAAGYTEPVVDELGYPIGIRNPITEEILWNNQIPEFAQQVLGIRTFEAEMLFKSGNSLPVIRTMIKGLIREEEVRASRRTS